MSDTTPAPSDGADEADAEPTFGVGFIGLGNIGGPMAKKLRDWPGGLTVLDARPEAMSPFTLAGARAASTPAEVASVSEVISVMVLNDAQVRAVVAGTEGIFCNALPGTVVAIHSTISADTAIELAALGESHGVTVIDAPVSGGAMGAHSGSLAVMAGGPAAAIDKCRAPFARWAGLVAHLGPVGNGTKAKLARNLLHFTSYAAVGEALRLAEAAGVDLVKLGEVVRHSDAITSGAGAIMLRDTAEPIPHGDNLRPYFEHARTLGEKDLHYALELGAELGLELPLAAAASQLLASALGVPHEPSDVHDPTHTIHGHHPDSPEER